MGDMGEIFSAMREHNKEVRQKKRDNFEPKLKEIGAIEKSDGVWELNGFFLYPTKGFAMNKKNPDDRRNLNKFIKETQCSQN